MSRFLLISVRLHDGRYHGTGEGPPSPARVFQALIAGIGLGGPLNAVALNALRWIEGRDAPSVASPRLIDGQGIKNFVPNNDLDAVAGDPRRIGEIRTQKIFRPRLFNSDIPFLFGWNFAGNEDDERQANVVCALAEQIYQFGRGVDFAWAWGELLDDHEFEERLAAHPGIVYRPSMGGTGLTLACPQPGSLQSLQDRYQANSRRFTTVRQGKTVKQLFSQPSKPRFEQVAYDSPPTRSVYELRDITTEALFAWRTARVVRLVEAVRDGAVVRLQKALPERSSEIERFLVGGKASRTDRTPASARVRIVPLPSIGHHHVDRDVRRVLVEVPSECPLRAEDVHWAMSGLELVDPDTLETYGVTLTPSTDDSMLNHFGIGSRTSRVWRTITPAALPEPVSRRRIDPSRKTAEAKSGFERASEQKNAAAAIVQALRHAGIRTRAEMIRVQREPFEAKGQRVESFAPGTRFAKERLWHVEVSFNEPLAGPLVIADGRFLGLGVMTPVQRCDGVFAFSIEEGLATTTEPVVVARSLRRAVMARVQTVLGARTRLPTFFTGHEWDGSVAQTETCPHITFSFDPIEIRLLVIAPHVVARRMPTREEAIHLETLGEAMAGMDEIRAGSAGRLVLRETHIDSASDPLFAASRIWESVTSYQVTRHAKSVSASAVFSTDLVTECRRRGLPEPLVTARKTVGLPGVGLIGHATLEFKVAVEGPIILGRSRHLGGGLFAGRHK